MLRNENELEINDKNQRTEADIIVNKDSALQKLDSLLLNYISNTNTASKADKLSYWLKDYCSLLKAEETFDPKYLKSYNRGDVIQVNLGYNIGNEEGGLHYCIVLDKHNSKKSGIITVIPLTSDKGQNLDFSEISLGNEVYSSFKTKYNALMIELSSKLNSMNVAETSSDDVHCTLENLAFLKRMDKKMAKMKKGSIALIGQITTISKQRICDPQKTNDLLSGICISDASLDLINNKMKQLYIK